jgi:hypothetical protein
MQALEVESKRESYKSCGLIKDKVNLLVAYAKINRRNFFRISKAKNTYFPC